MDGSLLTALGTMEIEDRKTPPVPLFLNSGDHNQCLGLLPVKPIFIDDELDPILIFPWLNILRIHVYNIQWKTIDGDKKIRNTGRWWVCHHPATGSGVLSFPARHPRTT